MQGRSAGSYFGSFATLVPQNPEVRHEILKAAQALADENEPARLRQREIASIRDELEAIREEVIGFYRNARSLIFSELCKYGYNPEEPRVPKRQAGGGQWTRVAANDDPNEVSDDDWFPSQPYGRGHHWVPRTVYEKRIFSNEVKSFFDNERSGPLANRKINSNTVEHMAYNDAVDKLLDDYLAKNEIVEEKMTLAQAKEFLDEVLSSEVPTIRSFVRKIKWEVVRYNMRYGPGRPRGDEE